MGRAPFRLFRRLVVGRSTDLGRVTDTLGPLSIPNPARLGRMTSRHALRLPDGRVLDVDDTGDDAGSASSGVLVWHNGSPHTGGLLPPIVALGTTRGLRVVTYARPS